MSILTVALQAKSSVYRNCCWMYLVGIDGDDAWEDSPDDNLIASRSGQATRVGEVVIRVNSLDELAKVDVTDEGGVWLSHTLDGLSAPLLLE